MTEIKKYTRRMVASGSSSSSNKGTSDNPYTEDEFFNYPDDWPGGYVEGRGYVGPDAVIHGSSSSSLSSSDSWDLSTPWDSWSSDDFNPWPNQPYDGGEQNTGGGGTGGGGETPTPSGTSQGGGTTPSPGSNIDLRVGNHPEISTYSRNLLKNLRGYKGKIIITSARRSPEHQARVMLNNIKTKGYQYQLGLYNKNYGRKVIETYNPQLNDEANIKAMTNKIIELGPRNISHHCTETLEEYNKLNVIDIDINSLSNVDSFTTALKASNKDIIIRIEKRNHCVHVEIPQP